VNFIEINLAKLARKGNRQAFADLVEIYKDKIYHLCFRMLGNPQEAEDAVQETFMRVYIHIDRFDEHQKFSTWIFRIATNLCIDLLRKRKIIHSLDFHNSDQNKIDFYSILPSNEVSLEQQIILSETQRQIQKAIDSLPERYKSIIILKYMEDMSLQEIADILHLTVSTVKTRVHRGREFLRKKLIADPT
jgi:RNA polymerase sigma-70 factor (ECF subfamily)